MSLVQCTYEDREQGYGHVVVCPTLPSDDFRATLGSRRTRVLARWRTDVKSSSGGYRELPVRLLASLRVVSLAG